MNELTNYANLICLVGMAVMAIVLFIAVGKIARTFTSSGTKRPNIGRDGMDIEDSPSPSHDYVLPDDLQEIARDTAKLETALSETRHTIWDDD